MKDAPPPSHGGEPRKAPANRAITLPASRYTEEEKVRTIITGNSQIFLPSSPFQRQNEKRLRSPASPHTEHPADRRGRRSKSSY
ncbi:hypothetical protein E2C01_050168 [Portunus trituberculatus]|uniref:Uncharacterized protein n=1 Tax=Portunus trituberculatus TaxID=210409 RepID=A0A5B7GFR4_PORTR|nr:hypothetical protein [Portunus trituberculatus]